MNTVNDSKVGSRLSRFFLFVFAAAMSVWLVSLASSPLASASDAWPAENFQSPYTQRVEQSSLSVSISGAAAGALNTPYTFTSTVSPVTATLPLAHIWRATEQPPLTLISGLTSTVVYTWTLPGVKAITVTVADGAGMVAVGYHTITVGLPGAPTQLTFFQPGNGSTGNPLWITAQVDPLTVTLPITYTWNATDLAPITLVRNTIQGGSWSGNSGWYGQYVYASLTWSSAGAKTITLTASNAAGSIAATQVVAISLSPSLVLTGSLSPQLGVPYTYTATVSPITATLPIYYSWYGTSQPWSGGTGGLSDTATYTWTTPGNKVVQVWINNANGWDQDALLVKIPAPMPLLTPTLESVSSGGWSNPATWNLGRAPLVTDVVLIHSGHTVAAAAPVHVDSLINQGALLGSNVGAWAITATNVLSNSGLIKAADAVVLSLPLPSYHPACSGLGGTPGTNIVVVATLTFNNGIIQAGNGLNGGRGGDVSWTPSPNTTLWNGPSGVIRAGDGGNGLPGGGGGPGGDVTVSGKPFDNDGLIRAGDGGDGDQCGGDGGSTYVFGENSTNMGVIDAGDGGDTTDNLAAAHGGDGGETQVWGKFFTWNGFLVNVGAITAGDGGSGNPGAAIAQDAGCGGNLTLMAAPNVFLGGGTHAAGSAGTPSAGGAACTDGWVCIDPASISLAGDARVAGGNISIYGGDGWTLDLRHLGGETISATGDITLAVGSGGALDLTGNAGRVLQADGQVRIYADNILLDPGVPLFALAGPNVVVEPARVLHFVSIVAADQALAAPGDIVPLRFRVLNTSPVTDTFVLSQSDTLGWSVSGLPYSITLDALGNQEVTLYVTVPLEAQSGEANEITVGAVSQTDPQASASAQTLVVVTANPTRAFHVAAEPEVLSVYAIAVRPVVITNIGAAANTFDLTLTGDDWPASLSAGTLALAPGLSATVFLTVELPSTAAPFDTDALTLTVTPQSGAPLELALLTSAGCRFDFDSNGLVDVTDLVVLLGELGGVNPYFDMSHDGSVDVTDMVVVLGRFGAGCE